MGTLIASPRDAPLETVVASGDEKGISPEFPVGDVREALQKITTSAGFSATERSRKLLEYLVSETLEGRACRIKAYSIGTVVFGRPDTFDPQKDPIVRIEAARLRRELEHYYLTDGADDALVIDIPKGAYVPRFIRRPSTAAETATTAAGALASGLAGNGWRAHLPLLGMVAGLSLLLLGVLAVSLTGPGHQADVPPAVPIPGLLVKPLTDLSHNRDSAVLAQGLTERIIEKASRFKELAVIPGDSGPAEVPTSRARYEFGGTLRVDGNQLLVQTRLADRTDGRVIWADSYSVALKPDQLFNVELSVADQIATRIAEPSGIVFEAEKRMWLEAPPDSLNAYLCTLSAYVYRATFSASRFPAMRACLEQAVAVHPDYATAWALLSLAYVDEYRFFYAPPQDAATPALTRAYDAARRAVELDASNVRGQQALMMTLFFRKDYGAGVDVGARALAMNPNDVELKGDYGYRLAVTGMWAEGCPLVQQAMEGSARKIAYIHTAMALCRFYGNDVAAAASLVTQADAEENPVYHVIAAAILAEAGDAASAREHREWLEHNTPRQLDQMLTELPLRLIRLQDRARFIDALRKAGFAVAS